MNGLSVAAPRGGRFLIVDDDQGVTQTVGGILQLEGHDVRTANNAAEALLVVSAFQPEAIIVDLRMPLVNGLGFLYRLRLQPQCVAVPVAVITGDCAVPEESLREIRELGAELHYKPMWGDEVVALASDLLARGERQAA
jgi:DNA-binding response OmpR family regulator